MSDYLPSIGQLYFLLFIYLFLKETVQSKQLKYVTISIPKDSFIPLYKIIWYKIKNKIAQFFGGYTYKNKMWKCFDKAISPTDNCTHACFIKHCFDKDGKEYKSLGQKNF